MDSFLKLPFDKEVIKTLIPHRDPFLLIDEVISIDPGISAVAKKQLFPDDWYFKGHFPSKPIMPGVLIVESLAQTAAVCAVVSLGAEYKNKPVYFVTIDEAKFRKPVFPGDALFYCVTVQKKVRSLWFFECCAKVNDVVVTNAVIRATIGEY